MFGESVQSFYILQLSPSFSIYNILVLTLDFTSDLFPSILRMIVRIIRKCKTIVKVPKIVHEIVSRFVTSSFLFHMSRRILQDHYHYIIRSIQIIVYTTIILTRHHI